MNPSLLGHVFSVVTQRGEERCVTTLKTCCVADYMNPRCLVLWTSVCDLAPGKYVFGLMPTGFGKSLIFQLFLRLAKAALILENSTIIVVSPLISAIMRDQVEQLKKLGFSAAAIWHR